MSEHPPEQPTRKDDARAEEQPFRLGRLLGIILIVLVALAAASAVVDVLVLGPLEGRVF